MKIRNDDVRAFIVKAEIVIKGGERAPDGTVFINPRQTVTVKDDAGKKMAKMYPNITVLSESKEGAADVGSSDG